jgi:hypothetical protein
VTDRLPPARYNGFVGVLNVVYGLAYAELGAIIVATIWNGLHGRGYKISGRLPPVGTRNGVISRLILVVGIVPAEVLVVGQASSNFTDPYTWWYVIGQVMLLLIVCSLAVIATSIRRSGSRQGTRDR